MLEWLFGSSPSPKNTKTPKEEPKSKLEEWLAIYEGQPVKYRLPCTLAAGSVVMLAFQIIYRIHSRRYPTHEWITPDLYAKKLWIKGILGHFGKRAQPYSSEALNWLQKMVLGKVVYCQLLKRDHYGRAVIRYMKVCAVMLPNGFLSRFSTRRWGLPLADEMLRAGLATVYTNKDAVYGPGGLEGHQVIEAKAKSEAEEGAQVIEAKAKKRRKGRWVDGPDIESPSEWKRRYRLSASPEELLDPVIESERAEQIEKVNGSGKNGKSRRK
ncbi:nuclease [Sanghuangporus baumii]|uniref:Nuclease n=1 Tax=Sanghuangporus baumii TaxID=108892 RepID=A0A9Q5N4D0_SANBA|nr:nuclease [Sanghuangporus baumii]